MRENLVQANPFHLISGVKTGRRLPVTLDVAQVSRLLDAPNAYWSRQLAAERQDQRGDAEFAAARDTSILEVIYSGGLRVSEAMGINLEDIDFSAMSSRFRGKGPRSASATSGNLRPRLCGNTSASERIAVLPVAARQGRFS